jgi:hypothetical protein
MQNQSISRIQIVAGGQGYVGGDFNITSSEGFGFEGSFSVNRTGVITITSVESHGRDYTTDPSVYEMYYPGTSVKQVPKSIVFSDFFLLFISSDNDCTCADKHNHRPEHCKCRLGLRKW